MNAATWWFLGGGMFLSVGLALLVRQAWPGEGRRVAGTVVGMAVLSLWGLWVAGPALPVGWISPVREGFTPVHLVLTSGHGATSGVIHDVLGRALAPGQNGLRRLVGLNLGATLAFLLGLGVLLHRLWGRAGLWVLGGVAVAPATWTLAFAETSSGTAAPVVLGFALTVPVLRDPDRPGSTRALAALVHAGLTILLLGVRVDTGLLAGLAGLLAGLAGVGAVSRWEGAWTRGWTPRRAALAVGALAAVGLVAWGLHLWWYVELPFPLGALGRGHGGRVLGVPSHRWARLVLGLEPSLAGWVRWVGPVAASVGPGVAVVLVLAVIRGLRRPLWTAGALAWPLVASAYLASSHLARDGMSPAEVTRHMISWLPLIWLLVLDEAAQRVPVGRRWPWLLALAWPALPFPGGLPAPRPGVDPALAAFAPSDGWPGPVSPPASLGQWEVQALLARREAFPDCAIVSFGRSWQGHDDVWAAHVPWAPKAGLHVPGWLDTPRLGPEVPLESALEALVGPSGCVHVWQGVDCASQTLTCPDMGPLDERWTWPAVPYVHADHGMRWAVGDVEVGWRVVR